MEDLWHTDSPRLLSDAQLARIIGVTPGYIPKLRAKGLLAKRKKVPTGKAGGKGVQRYSFLEAVAAEVARISAAEFGWQDRDLRRVVSIISSGDEERVRAAKVVALTGELPGTINVLLFAPEEDGADRAMLAEAEARNQVLQDPSLLEIVERVANVLYDKMVAAGVEFSGVAGPKKKTRRARN